MNKHIGPVLAVVATLGIVGGVAAAQALNHPASKPAQVRLVQPAAETATPDPVVTTTTEPAPAPTTAAPAPVQSVKAKAPAPAPVQRQAVVSETPVDPAPASNVGTVVTKPDGSTGVSIKPGQAPPPLPAHPAPSPTTP